MKIAETSKDVKDYMVRIDKLRQTMVNCNFEIQRLCKMLDLKPTKYISRVSAKAVNSIGVAQKEKWLRVADEICNQVFIMTKIPVRLIKKKTRKKEICQARQICILLIYETTQLSLEDIAEYFSPAIGHHTTCMNALKKINKLYKENATLRRQICALKHRCRKLTNELSTQPEQQAA